MPNKYYKIYNESSGPLELYHWCYRLTKIVYFEIKITLLTSLDFLLLFPEDLWRKAHVKSTVSFQLSECIFIYLMISYMKLLVDLTGMTYFIVREL